MPPKKTKTKPQPKTTIGTRIALALDKAGMSIAGLASKAKLSSSFMSLVVSDKRQLSPESLRTVAEILGVKSRSLMTDDQLSDLKALQACANG